MSIQIEKKVERMKMYVYSVLSIFSPELNTKAHFYFKYNEIPNLKNPETFSEKLTWLKLYQYCSSPLVKQCADKLLVREYVEKQGCGSMLNKLLGVYNNPFELPWADLPNQFALKWSFGSGLNVICTDKSAIDSEKITHELIRMGKSRVWLNYAELQYKTKKRVLLCERYLAPPQGETLLDYKFYCFHGKAMAILVIYRTTEKGECAAFFSPEWEYVSDIPDRYEKTFYPLRPPHLLEMLNAAEILSAPFPFVRVDFYDLPDGPVFGEMTFTPAAGLHPSETIIDGHHMGEYIKIPSKNN